VTEYAETYAETAAAAEGRTSKVQRNLVELNDGSTILVRITMPDRIRWDMTAPRRGWPKGTDAPFLWQSFITWAAAKRSGLFDGDWDAWNGVGGEPGRLVEITPLADDEPVGPTNPAPSPTRS